jgi:predicted secreted protein
MKIRTFAAAAGFGASLLAAGCTPATPADKPVDPAAPDEFADALNFDCETAGKLDLILNEEEPRSARVRLAGGAPMTLPADTTAPSGMIYKDDKTTINLEMGDLQLTTGGATNVCKFVSRDLPAPKVEGVVRDLTSADAGASVDMKVGEKISVSLVGVPTAGYVWGAATPPAFVTVSDGPGGSTTTAQRLPGFAGGNHWEVLVIEAVSPGEGEITLVQKRPWETQPDPGDQTFKFRLKVQ